MRRRILLTTVFVLGVATGFFGHGWRQALAPGSAPPSADAVEPPAPPPADGHHTDADYVCPMHPAVLRHAPGSCPICGMDLVLRPAEAAAAAPAAGHGPAPGALELSPAVINRLGVRTAAVRHGTLERRLEAVGSYFLVAAPVSRGAASPDTPAAPASRNMVLAQVFEGQAALVQQGQSAQIRIPSAGPQSWKGTVEYVDAQLSQGTRTLRFRIGFDPGALAIKVGSSARVRLEVDPVTDALLVPREAVIATGRGARVVVSLDGGRFEPRPVAIEDYGEDEVVVQSGLAAGDRVVVSAQFLIDSEASMQAGLRRLDAGQDQQASTGGNR
jgi:multidrug efflux pump subunit AcrA (membrane-fusion protein)